jgi:hypothetical protein
LLEKTAVKLLPIMKALKKKMAFEEDDPNAGKEPRQLSSTSKVSEEPATLAENADMKNLLGYLNQ